MAWGLGPFDNDAAMGWLADTIDTGPASVALLLRRVAALEPSVAIDVVTASDVVAAAELVATAVGRGTGDEPPEVSRWLEHHGPGFGPGLVEPAVSALLVVREASELRDRWLEAGALEGWTGTVDDLALRLASTEVR